jgi:hypothetical protein
MKSNIVALGIVCTLLGVSSSFGQQPPELNVLNRLVGTWDWKVTAKPSEWTKAEVTTTGTLTREWVLQGRFIQELGGTVDQPSMCYWGYDPQKQTYRMWHFGIEGQSEHEGVWNAESKTMTWNADLGNGITAVGTSVFIDQDSDEWKMLAKDNKGKVYLNLEGKNKRKAGEKILLEGEKKIASDATQSAELKVLEPLIGNWDAELLYKPAEWTPQELQSKRSYQGQWVLNNRFIMSTAKDSDGLESIFLWTYDSQAHHYKMWRFTSKGDTTKAVGVWDSTSKALLMKSQLKEDLTFRMRVHLTDENQHDWVGTVTDNTGKLFFHMDGQGRRRKE